MGAFHYFKDGKLDVPPEFEERTVQLLRESDSIRTFIERKLEITISKDITKKFDYVKKAELGREYLAFCTKNGQRSQRRDVLMNRLSQMGIISTEHNGYDSFKGIKIISLPDDMPKLINNDMFSFSTISQNSDVEHDSSESINNSSVNIENLIK